MAGLISNGSYLLQAGNVDYATNAGHATNASNDDEGNNIIGTYATITQVADKQDKLTDVTDIQLVSSLPANPVATVLYLIPEA